MGLIRRLETSVWKFIGTVHSQLMNKNVYIFHAHYCTIVTSNFMLSIPLCYEEL